jgi:hypothetical protein
VIYGKKEGTVADKKLPQKGFIKQEEIKFEDLLSTMNGRLFK